MNKVLLYEDLQKRIQAIVADESDLIANMANVAAEINATFHFWWIGFYRVMGNELVLGPFQGPLACTRIPKGRGVCGSCWERGQTIVVPNVELFEGHIACSSFSKSEIVVPIYHDGTTIGVLDIDSEKLNNFDDIDAKYLEKIVKLLIKEES